MYCTAPHCTARVELTRAKRSGGAPVLGAEEVAEAAGLPRRTALLLFDLQRLLRHQRRLLARASARTRRTSLALRAVLVDPHRRACRVHRVHGVQSLLRLLRPAFHQEVRERLGQQLRAASNIQAGNRTKSKERKKWCPELTQACVLYSKYTNADVYWKVQQSRNVRRT